MRGRKLPVLLAFCLLCGSESFGARTPSISVGGNGSGTSVSVMDKESPISSHSTHRQYTHSLENGASVSYGSKPAASSLSISPTGSSYGSSESSGSRNNGGFSQSAGSSVEYGNVAEGSFQNLFPAVAPSSGYGSPTSSSSGGYQHQPVSGGYPSVSGGYPSSSMGNIQGQQPPSIDNTQPHGPSYTYYYQHYPGSTSGGGWSSGGHEDEGHGGGFGDLMGGGFGGGAGGGLGGLGGLAGLKGIKGLGILAAAAKGVLAIKPFLILGLLLLIAFPVLLLFLPLPIITINPANMVASGGRSDTSVMSYLTQLSEKVLTSEECLERFFCKLPKAPEPYQKNAKSLWDSYGQTFVKNERLSRGLGAYFESAKEKNRQFKCNQKFQCSNKYI